MSDNPAPGPTMGGTWHQAFTARFRAMAERLKFWLLIVSIRTKIMGLIIASSLALGLFATLLIASVMKENMQVSLREEGVSVSRELASLANEYLLLNDLYGLARLLHQTVDNRKDLRYAVAMDNKGQVLAHSFGPGFPPDLLTTPFNVKSDEPVPLITNEGIIWEAYHSFANGEGGVRVGISESRLRQQRLAVVEKLMLGTMAMAFLGIIATGLLVWLITRPVNNLLTGTLAISQGEYGVQVPGAPRDEIGRLIEGFNEMSHQLALADKERLARERMRQDFLQAIINAQENERQRIARELHDQTGQALASLMVGLKLLERAESAPEIHRNMARLRETISAEMESIHRLVLDLRPSVLDDLGMVAAIRRYANDYEALHAISVNCVIIGFDGQRPPAYIETCVYRIVQEALTNAARHAEAKAVKIILEWKNDTIRGVVEDDGIGFDPDVDKGQRLGIWGMDERIALLDGHFRIESEPGAGTLVAFDLPVRDNQRGEQP